MEQQAVESRLANGVNDMKFKDERDKKRYERKLNLAYDPDSIFIMPVGGRMGIGFVINLTNLDRAVNVLKKNIIFKVSQEEGADIFAKLQAISDALWKTVRENVPALHSFSAAKWRELNDTKDKKLVLANRKSSMVILPRDERIAQIIAAIKVLNEKIFDYQVSGQFEELGNLVTKYKDIDADIVSITDTIDSLVPPPRKKKGAPSAERGGNGANGGNSA